MAHPVDLKIQNIVSQILTDVEAEHDGAAMNAHTRLDKNAIIQVIDDIERILFPAHFSNRERAPEFAVRYEVGNALEHVYTNLSVQIASALRFRENGMDLTAEERTAMGAELTGKFLDSLVKVREYLKTDLQAAYDGDPAAYNLDEIIYSYPGFYAIMVNRVAHELFLLQIPLIPRIMTEYAHSTTGIDIHPGATIGKYFFIDHGTGVVIGETTVIGEHVKMYQGVTLGGLSTRAGQGLRNKKRHPTIGNDVTIYSNASVLGGNTVIGDGCVIGGSCFITESIPAHMRVSNISTKPEIRPDPNAQGVEL